MMLQLNDNGEFTSVNEEELIYVNKKELDELFERYEELEKENKKLKQQLKANTDFLIHASKRLGFKSLDHLLYTLNKGEIFGYSTANWEDME